MSTTAVTPYTAVSLDGRTCLYSGTKAIAQMRLISSGNEASQWFRSYTPAAVEIENLEAATTMVERRI
jgi:hypothetical protein